MKTIASADNPLCKLVRALARDPAATRKTGMVWLEGPHLVRAALDAGLDYEALLSSEPGLQQPELAALLQRVDAARVVLLAPRLFAAVSGVEHGPQLGLLLRRPAPAALRPGSVLVLDRVQDAGNVGTLLRTAAAAGCGGAVLLPGCAGAWTPKVLRAGMGAQFTLPVLEDCDWDRVRDQLPRPVLATAGGGRKSLYEIDLRQPVTWVFGHEGQGVDPSILAACDATVSIPQQAEVESLNVAAAAAICLFEGVRQQRA